jgi:hypothetical protein
VHRSLPPVPRPLLHHPRPRSPPTATAGTSTRTRDAPSPDLARTPAPADVPTNRCDSKPGMIEVRRQAGAPPGLTFCPALLNGGAPLDGPFTATGKILGSEDLFASLVIVNRADPGTCDAYGNPPDAGYYYAQGMTIDSDGTWEFRDGLGYDEAVTIGRTYTFVTGPVEVLDAIRTDREVNGADGYTGMGSLPAKAQVVATFYQAPGKYNGKSSPPCKDR